jgi:hypothetical protein
MTKYDIIITLFDIKFKIFNIIAENDEDANNKAVAYVFVNLKIKARKRDDNFSDIDFSDLFITKL